MQQPELRTEFIHGSIARLLWKNAVPATVAMLVMALYQMVDGAMVGRRLGPDALAAVNVLYPLLALLVALAVMIGVGGAARVAVLMGSGKHAEARGVFSFVVLLGVALGVVGTAVVGTFLEPLLDLLGAATTLREPAAAYLRTMTPFFTSYISLFILEQMVRNDGRGGFAGAVMAGTAVLNIVLDYLFLYPFAMGISGAALASGISQTIGSVLMVVSFVRAPGGATARLRFARPHGGWLTLYAVALNGSSELFSSLALGVVTLVFNRALMAHAGTAGVAAFALVQYLTMMAFVFVAGVANGAQPIISHNHGAGRSDRVRSALYGAMGTATAIAAVLVAVGMGFAGRMVELFVPDHPEAIRLTEEAARIVLWSILFAPLGYVGAVFFTAVERAGESLCSAAVRGLVVPVAAVTLLPRVWGAPGIWAAAPLAEVAGMIVALWLVRRWVRRFTRRADGGVGAPASIQRDPLLTVGADVV